jgi:hypothetical protein
VSTQVARPRANPDQAESAWSEKNGSHQRLERVLTAKPVSTFAERALVMANTDSGRFSTGKQLRRVTATELSEREDS